MQKKIISLILTSAVLFSACGEEPAAVEEKVFVPQVGTEIIAPGFSREIAATGEVEAQQSADLTSELRADIAKVNVKNGDFVSAGQVLIEMTSDDVATNLQTAIDAVANARAQLSATDASSLKSIESARASLATAETNLANTLAQNEKLRLQAEENLNSSKVSLDLAVAAAKTSLDNAISSSLPAALSAVSESDKILGVSPTYKSGVEDIEKFIGALDSESEQKAEKAIVAANQAIKQGNPKNYDEAHALLSVAEDATEKTLKTVRASTTSTTLTEATLAGYVTTINNQLNAVRASLGSLDSAKKAVDSAEQQNAGGGSQSLVSAGAAYEATLAQLAASEEAARRSVDSARVGVESAEKAADLNSVGGKTGIDSAQNQLRAARDRAEKLIIRAPFAGKMTNVAVKVGQEVSAGDLLASLANDGTLKIVAYLSGEDVARLSVGDEIKIGKSSSDKISAISPSADSDTKKYRVEILHANPYLSPGEFVRLRFPIESKNNGSGIFVPITAIQLADGGNFVWIVKTAEDGTLTTEQRDIEVSGLEGEFVKVSSGLQVGDEIIVDGGRIIEKEGTKIERE